MLIQGYECRMEGLKIEFTAILEDGRKAPVKIKIEPGMLKLRIEEDWVPLILDGPEPPFLTAPKRLALTLQAEPFGAQKDVIHVQMEDPI